jgi:hypothetical protein
MAWAVSAAFASGLVGCTGVEQVQLISFLSPFPDGLPNIQGGLHL